MNDNAPDTHLLQRAGFGPAPGDDSSLDLNTLLKEARAKKPLMVADRISLDGGEMNRKDFVRKAKEQLLALNSGWINQLSDPACRLREKMTLFWHDHFACRTRSPFLAQQNNNVLREHALGSFRSLLNAVSKDPAMLQFLNNQQNRKGKPNENFARELMELFTLGKGEYAEADVKEAARAFTGWAFNPLSGEFVFREKVHDDGIKTFLGMKGSLSGDDIINAILDRRTTSAFIVDKIYRYFVDDTSNRDVISSLAKKFYESDYSIEPLIKELLSSADFNSDRVRGNRIKSPVELLVGIMSQTGATFEQPGGALFIQRTLGQVLFYPPNVGGWPTGIAWIDSSSLAFRLSLPSLVLGSVEPDIEPKDDGDINNATNDMTTRRLSMRVDWALLDRQLSGYSAAETLERLEQYLLARRTTNANRAMIHRQLSHLPSGPDLVRRAFIAYMSLPEYQLS